MRWNTLSETLIELTRALVPPEGAGLLVTEAEFRVPLEVLLDPTGAGLVVRAQPAQSRWKSGFLPPTHMTRIAIRLENADAG